MSFCNGRTVDYHQQCGIFSFKANYSYFFRRLKKINFSLSKLNPVCRLRANFMLPNKGEKPGFYCGFL